MAENEKGPIVKLFVDGFEFCKKILKGLLKWHVESVKIFCPPPTRALNKIHECFQYVNTTVGLTVELKPAQFENATQHPNPMVTWCLRKTKA